jgi:N-methylhydantoinase B/oxoprolinase/acetone carboxylase alpha subunit
MLLVAFGGRQHAGGNFVTGDLIASGSGAWAGGDGVGVIETDATNCMNLPAEAMEMETPIRLNRVALRAGSGGAGRFRGGLGTVREYEVLVDNVTFTHRGERHFSAARGVFGGGDGAMARSVIVRADGSEEIIPSKIVTRLMRGDRVIVKTAGGAGYGEPGSRDPAMVEADVANGAVICLAEDP